MKALILAVLFLVGLCIVASGIVQGVAIMAVSLLIGFNLPLTKREKRIVKLNQLITHYRTTKGHNIALFNEIRSLKLELRGETVIV